MTTIWMLSTIGLLATTIGALIVFLHLHKTSRAAGGSPWPEVCAPLARDRRLLMIVTGLMAAWFVVQYTAVILI